MITAERAREIRMEQVNLENTLIEDVLTEIERLIVIATKKKYQFILWPDSYNSKTQETKEKINERLNHFGYSLNTIAVHWSK